MDFSKLSGNQQMTVIGAALVFIGAFMPWYGVTGLTVSGWSANLSGVVAIGLLVGAGVILVLEAMDRAPVDSPAEITFVMAAVGLLLMLYKLIAAGGFERRFGLFVAFLGAAVAAWGSYQNRLDNT